MSESALLVFIATSLLIILSPGQDMVLVLSRSIAQGPKAGLITSMGVCAGFLGHTTLAALGLGALLQTSEYAFTLMKLMGAAYLLYLGYKTLKAPLITLEQGRNQDGSLASCFIQGMISNISNPKIAIFYFAYLPQFIGPENTEPTETLLALGAGFALLACLVKMPIGYIAGLLSTWIKTRPAVQIWLNRSSGSVLIGMAVSLISTSHSA